MNNLSWMIYFADVADNLDWLLFLVATVSVFAAVAWIMVATIGQDDGEFTEANWKTWRKCGRHLAIIFFAGWIVGSIVPTKETMYAIAASELGETTLNSETGNKAIRALNAWLDRQMGGEDVPQGNSQ